MLSDTLRFIAIIATITILTIVGCHFLPDQTIARIILFSPYDYR